MIKIYVCSHNDNQDLVKLNQRFKFLTPLQVGVENNSNFKNFSYDNQGENISSLNPYYCELTGHYWAYQNETADYYGFCHYRRFLNFNSKVNKIYTFESDINNLYSSKYNYNNAQDIIRQYDIILPKCEKFSTSVYNHYKTSANHYIEDFDLVIDIIGELFPDFTDVLKSYVDDNQLFIGNIFVMKDIYFKEYSTWLFTILAEFDLRKPNKNPRANGFLAERLLGIYITKIKSNPQINILELPRIHIENDKLKYISKNITNLILPPSSKRRMLIRMIWRKKW